MFGLYFIILEKKKQSSKLILDSLLIYDKLEKCGLGNVEIGYDGCLGFYIIPSVC